MLKMRFIAMFLCLTVLFATYTGVSFADFEETKDYEIVIENGKVVSGNSELVDSGFIVIADEESSADEGEDSAQTEEPKEELSEDAKLQYILGNIGSFFKSESTQSAPAETPNAVSPTVPTESVKVDFPEIKSTTPGKTYCMGNDDTGYSAYGPHNARRIPNCFVLDDKNSGSGTTLTRVGRIKDDITDATIEFPIYYGLYFKALIDSGKTIEMVYCAEKFNSNADGNSFLENNYAVQYWQRGFIRYEDPEAQVPQYNRSHMFEVKGTLRIVGGQAPGTSNVYGGVTGDSNYGGYKGRYVNYYADSTEAKEPQPNPHNYKTLDADKFYIVGGRNGDAYSASAFLVDGGTLEIKNAVIQDCISTGNTGGAIHVKNGGKVYLENVVFDNCSANGSAGKGGAIFVEGDCIVKMKNCRITNTAVVDGVKLKNTAAYGGGLYVRCDTETPINNEPYNVYIQDTLIENCEATVSNGGGLYVYSGKVGITGSLNESLPTIQNCKATAHGGGLYVQTNELARATVWDVTIENCFAGTGGGGGMFVGANGKINVQDTTVQQCTTNGTGGGVFLNKAYGLDGGDVEFSNVKINNNKSGHDAGGLYVRDTVLNLMGNNEINNNTAIRFGGGMTVSTSATNASTVNINTAAGDTGKTTINGNTAHNSENLTDKSGSGGGVHVSSSLTSTLNMNGGEIKGNNALSGRGGGVDSQGILNLNGTIVSENTALKSGGGISIGNASGKTHSKAVLTNVVVQGNETTNEHGGGIYVYSLQPDSLTITDCSIGGDTAEKGNKATVGNGGGIFYGAGCLLKLDNMTVSNNNAVYGGGIAIGTDANSSVKLTNMTVEKNTATNCGGGVYINTGSLEIIGGTIGGDSAEKGNVVDGGVGADGNLIGEGGGIYANSSASVKFTKNGSRDVLVSNNRAKANGGGIFIINEVSLDLENVNVIKNSANSGGGVYVGQNSSANLKGSKISENAANVNGGGVWVGLDTSFTMTSGEVHDNTAGGNGGGIFFGRAHNDAYSLTGGVIYSNTADKNGGGVYLGVTDVSADGTKNEAVMGGDIEIYSNTATVNGGGVYVAARVGNRTVGVTMNQGAQIHSNIAKKSGGGVYATTGSTVNLNGAVVYGNKTIDNDGYGGGFWVGDVAAFTMISGEVYQNEGVYGGGMFFGRGTTTPIQLTGGKVYFNTARESGGGIHFGNSGDKTTPVKAEAVVGGGEDSTIEIYSNIATKNGGGIYLHNPGYTDSNGKKTGEVHVTITAGSKIYSNTAKGSGGGVHLQNCGETEKVIAIIKDSAEIYGNTATVSGGGVYANTNSELEITDVTIGGDTAEKGNTAGANGGGIGANSSKVTLGKVVIMNNEAGSNGGGVSVNGGSATLTGCYIVKNEANGTGTYTTTNGLKVDAVKGVGGGVAVFNSGTFTFIVTNKSGAIYDNTATVAASDVFANGSTNISLTIPAAADMDIDGATLNGVTIPAFGRDGNNNGKWFEDYMNDDTKYKEGLFGDRTGIAQRYKESAVSIRAFANKDEEGAAAQYSKRYVNTEKFVSIVFEVPVYNVGTITITAPSDEGVENQLFLFEVKGDPTKGEDFTLSVSLLGGKSVTITDLVPGTYTITQRTDWSWRFDYKNVTITGVESNVGTNEGNGVVKITISGTMRDEAHKAVYDNNKTQNKWLSHNSQCEKNVATLPVTAFFDVAEAKKGYVI